MDPLAHALIGIFVPLTLALCVALARRARPFIDPNTQALVLRYGWVIKGIAVVSLGLPVPGIMLLIEGVNNDRELVLYVCYVIFFSVMSLWAMLDAFWTRIILIPEGIMIYAVWRGVTSFSWEEVKEIRYSNGGKWFIVNSTDGRTIRVNTFLAGIHEFEKAVRQHLSPEQYQNAVQGFDFVNSGRWM
jgi:hypothetical protein